MKKVQIKGKLSLDKMTIAKLNDHQTTKVVGGGNGFTSIGYDCTQDYQCPSGRVSKGIWCYDA